MSCASVSGNQTYVSETAISLLPSALDPLQNSIVFMILRHLNKEAEGCLCIRQKKDGFLDLTLVHLSQTARNIVETLAAKNLGHKILSVEVRSLQSYRFVRTCFPHLKSLRIPFALYQELDENDQGKWKKVRRLVLMYPGPVARKRKFDTRHFPNLRAIWDVTRHH